MNTAELALIALIVLVLVISLVDNYGSSWENVGYSKKSLGGGLFGGIMAIIILYEYHLISLVQVNWVGSNVLRLDCLHSNKGGKRPLGGTSDEFRNPCFVAENLTIAATNTSNVTANDTDATGEISTAAGIHEYGDYQSTSFCISNRVSTSKDQFISAGRDCENGQHGMCSLHEPCTPCEISRFSEFYNSPRGWSRCQTCALANKYGKCSFVDGVGPYCWKDAYSQEVAPCRKCCTDGVAVLDDDGVCH